MDAQPLALIAAMPEETAPLLRRLGRATRDRLSGFIYYRFSFGNREVWLMESGMGPKRAAEAAHALIASAHPAIILNFGFAGAVGKELAVGDIVVAKRVLFHHDRLFSEHQGIAAGVTEQLAGFLDRDKGVRSYHVHRGTFITAAQIIGKGKMADLLPGGTPHAVLEMETSAVARVAAKEKVPLVALRAITDGADEELGFTIDEFTDRDMTIRIGKVLKTVARKPWIVPQLVRLSRNTKVAGKNLAEAMVTVMELLCDDCNQGILLPPAEE